MRVKRKKAIETAKRVMGIEHHAKGLVKSLGGVNEVIKGNNLENFGSVTLYLDVEFNYIKVEYLNGEGFTTYKYPLGDIEEIIKESKLPWEEESK